MSTSSTAPSTPRTETPPVGHIIAGKYRVEHTLGVGGMGVVVAARHLMLGQLVALKLLQPKEIDDPTAVERFLREAQAIAALRSEHVVRIMDVGTLDDGAPYLVMEHLEGATLSAIRRERGRLPPAEAVGYLLQACEGVAEAHALGIVHRDLKPANLFVTQRLDGSPIVKVLDFGVSKFMTSDAPGPPRLNLTATGMIIGSPDYMAPEQVLSSRRADTRSDIWSLGVTLYHLVSGVRPFRERNVGALFVAITQDPYPPLPSDDDPVLAALDAVIGRCLEKHPDRRFQTVGELARALMPFASEGDRQVAERIAPPSRTGVSPSDAPTAVVPSSSSSPVQTFPTVSTASPWMLDESRRHSRRAVFGACAVVAAGVLLVLLWVALEGSPTAPAPSIAAASSASPPPAPAAESIAPVPSGAASTAPSVAPSSSALPKAPRPGERRAP